MTFLAEHAAHLRAIILAGGAGTRFWPASRRSHPKQLLSFGRSGGSSLIAETLSRIERLCPPERVVIATGAHLVPATREALPSLPPAAFLGEPVARNTAACIAWATAVVARQDPEAIVLVLPSDHHIADVTEFQSVLTRALSSAASGTITTIGIQPTRPETGFGYIELGTALADGLFQVERFVEKPNRVRAEEYVAGKRHLWNSGMFFFRAATLLEAVRELVPQIWEGIQHIEAAARSGPEAEQRATSEAFAAFPSVSIDTAVMEKAKLNVVPGSFGWSDLGSWESAWELSEKDAAGNTLSESALYVDARNNLVIDRSANPRDKVVALVGVEDLCVVQTDDALLVIPRERSQDVRAVVEALDRARRHQLL